MNWIKRNWNRIKPTFIAILAFIGATVVLGLVKNKKLNPIVGGILIVILSVVGGFFVTKTIQPDIPMTFAAGLVIDDTSQSVRAASDTLTFEHTTAVSAVLVVAIAGSSDITGVTYSGDAMAEEVGIEHSGEFIHIFSLGNPASGANDVVATAASSGEIMGGAISFTGGDADDVVSNVASATVDNNSGHTYSLTVDNNDSFIVDAVSQSHLWNPDAQPAEGGTKFANVEGSTNVDFDAQQEGTVASGSHDVGWTWGGAFASDSALAAVAVQPGGAAPADSSEAKQDIIWFE